MSSNPLRSPDAPHRPFPMTPVVLLTLTFFFNFVARIIMAPLMPTVEADLGLGHGQAGSLFLVGAAGYMLALICSPLVASRLTHRGVIVLSALAVGLSLAAVSLSGGLGALRGGLFALGLAAGLYLPSGLATLTASISPKQWGRAIGIHEVAPNAAFILAPLLAEVLLWGTSWRGALRATALATILVGGLYVCCCRQGGSRGVPPDVSALGRLGRERNFWLMMILFSLGISSTLGVYTMLPLFLVTDHAFSPSEANLIFAFSRISTLATALLGGWATDRFGPQRTMATAMGASGLCTLLLGVAPGTAVPVLLFLQPVLAVSFFPAGFATLSRIGPPEARNLVVAFTVPLAFLMGGGVVPALIGYMGETGHLGIGISLTGALIAAGALLVRGLKTH
jgi:NNP family nitrate/nitrite transporter-like MFS transporter